MTDNTKYTLFTTVALVATLLVYLCGSFVHMSFDPREWHMFTRALAAAGVWLWLTVFMVGIALDR